ncbi:MAG: histidine triad nucleotide-binding protein, partial [Mycobacteriales bacterium]
CLFCRIVAGEVPAAVVHETKTVLAFHDIAPKVPVHVLVIPKNHHVTLADLATANPEVVGEIAVAVGEIAVAEGIDASGYRVLFNTGRHAGQEVFHVHAHILGGAPLGPMVSPPAG